MTQFLQVVDTLDWSGLLGIGWSIISVHMVIIPSFLQAKVNRNLSYAQQIGLERTISSDTIWIGLQI